MLGNLMHKMYLPQREFADILRGRVSEYSTLYDERLGPELARMEGPFTVYFRCGFNHPIPVLGVECLAYAIHTYPPGHNIAGQQYVTFTLGAIVSCMNMPKDVRVDFSRGRALYPR